MMEHPAAPLLAADLGKLPHTNARGERGVIHIPGFLSTTGTSPEQAAEVGLLGLAIAEAVIEDLTVHGYPPTSKADIDAKIQEVKDKQAVGELMLHCNRCLRPVLKVDAGADAPKLHVKLSVQMLQAHMEQCR
jgi:hypothetical protein